MRVSRASLGQITSTTCAAAGGFWNATNNTCAAQAPVGSAQACAAADETWNPTTQTCSPSVPSAAIPPAVPPDALTTQTGVLPGNISGQTVASLPGTSEALCEQQGGSWNGAVCDYSALNSEYCTQFPFGGVYDAATGKCGYVNFYLTLGGIALLAFVLIVIAKK